MMKNKVKAALLVGFVAVVTFVAQHPEIIEAGGRWSRMD